MTSTEKFKSRQVFFIDSHDFDEFIHEIYRNKTYHFVPDYEANNDSCYSFKISSEKPLSVYDQEKLDKFCTGKYAQGMTWIFFQDLVNRKILEPGIYIVEVCW